MDDEKCKMHDAGCRIGNASVGCCSAFMDDGPPFVGLVDADNLTCLVRWCAYGVNYATFPRNPSRPSLAI
jgi:hypothetical protein